MPAEKFATWPRMLHLIALALLAVSYWLGTTTRIDVMYDDGFYLALSQAIASGDGYQRTWYLPSAWETTVPPAYAAMLAPIWWLFPDFPHNIPVFKLPNVGFALATVVLTHLTATRLFQFHGWQALLAAGLVAFSQLHIVFIDFTMIEVVLSCALTLSMLALSLVLQRPNPPLWPNAWLVAVLAVGPCYLKKAAFPLLVATSLWLALQRRWQLAVVATGWMAGLLLPWYVYRIALNYDVVQAVTMVGARPVDTLTPLARMQQNALELVSVSIPYSVTSVFGALASLGPWVGPLMSVVVLLGLGWLTRRGPALYALFVATYAFLIVVINTWDTLRFTLVLTPIIALAWVAATTTPLARLLEGPSDRWHRAAWAAALCLALVPAGLVFWSAKRFVGIFLHPPYHDALLSPADRESAEDFQALVAWERQQS
ncbi:MAG: hypothetical protein VKP62_05270, partial [Candidatus Sericytochromatia bacterium]|nr:hypothetical protein [Candidatus Sericytochromatia bacterium]